MIDMFKGGEIRSLKSHSVDNSIPVSFSPSKIDPRKFLSQTVNGMTGSSKETSTDQVHNFRRISLNSFQPKLHWESIFILPRITTSHCRKPVAAIKEFSPVAMRRQGLLNPRAYFNARKTPHGLQYTEPASVASAIFLHNRKFLVRAKIPSVRKIVKWGSVNTNCTIQASDYKGMLDENQGESSDSDEDDELCPVECVREFKTDKEFLKILERAKETDSLVVVDFYRTSCGSCKYIEQGFTKLCRVSGDQEAPVIFLKHNVIDEYDEQSEVAEKLRIKAVPLFHFYKNGVLQEAFATRDKERILAAILKYA